MLHVLETSSAGVPAQHCSPRLCWGGTFGSGAWPWFGVVFGRVGAVRELLPGDPHCSLVLQAEGVKAEPFESHSALEIAEQLTLLDHLVFKKIPYE